MYLAIHVHLKQISVSDYWLKYLLDTNTCWLFIVKKMSSSFASSVLSLYLSIKSTDAAFQSNGLQSKLQHSNPMCSQH